MELATRPDASPGRWVAETKKRQAMKCSSPASCFATAVAKGADQRLRTNDDVVANSFDVLHAHGDVSCLGFFSR